MWTVLGLFISVFIAGLVSAQTNSPYCDPVSGICWSGYSDPETNITIGFVLPEDLTSNEFLVELISPIDFYWTGVSVGGTMANSLLLVVWPYNGEVIFSARWTAGYVQPTPYPGPTVSLLPSTLINSTHVKANLRCQNCTVWEGGSLGSGDLNGFQLIGYVANTLYSVDDPSNPASNFTEHDQLGFFGTNLTTTHSPDYEEYLTAGASQPTTTTTVSKSTTISTSKSTTTTVSKSTTTSTSTSTTTAAAATQTKYGQCAGNGYNGPTVCASGSTCTAVSPPYYYQCL